jgi:hypothetical protein
MSDPKPITAKVIAFPLSRQQAPGRDEGQERLRRALVSLDDAIAGQRAAVAAWRSSLADLSKVVSGLGENLQRYRGSLDTLGTRVAGLHNKAVRPERTADAALAAQGD